VRTKSGADSGDATVPLWSATLPGADMYYVQEVHRDLPKNSDVIDAVVDLTYGRVPDLPDTLPEPKGGCVSGWKMAPRPTRTCRNCSSSIAKLPDDDDRLLRNFTYVMLRRPKHL